MYLCVKASIQARGNTIFVTEIMYPTELHLQIVGIQCRVGIHDTGQISVSGGSSRHLFRHQNILQGLFSYSVPTLYYKCEVFVLIFCLVSVIWFPKVASLSQSIGQEANPEQTTSMLFRLDLSRSLLQKKRRRVRWHEIAVGDQPHTPAILTSEKRGWAGRSGMFRQGARLFTLPAIKPKSHGRPACTLITTLPTA